MVAVGVYLVKSEFTFVTPKPPKVTLPSKLETGLPLAQAFYIW